MSLLLSPSKTNDLKLITQINEKGSDLKTSLTKGGDQFNFITQTELPNQKVAMDEVSWDTKKKTNEEAETHRWKTRCYKARYSFHPQQEDYFAPLPLKPGIDFYRKLATTTYDIENLKLRIPDTFCHFGSYSYLYFDEMLRRIPDYSIKSFYSKMIKLKEEKNRNPYHREDFEYICVLKNGISDKYFGINTDILTDSTFKDKSLYGIESGSLIQEYIESFSGSVVLYRLVYYLNSNEGKASHLHIIVNNHKISDKNVHDNFKSQTCYLQNACNIYVELSSHIPELEDYAKTVSIFMNRAFGYRIKYIVLDFIKSTNLQFYLIGLKSFQLLKDNYEFICTGVPRMTKVVSVQELIAPLRCRLCSFYYKKPEMTKRLPLKMLLQVQLHLRKRGLFVFDLNENLPHQFLLHDCNVCTLCYELIVKEFQLIEIERKMAIAQNIPVKGETTSLEFKRSEQKLNRPPGLSKEMIQWRILFYFKTFNNVNLKINEDSNIILTYSIFPSHKSIISSKSEFRMENTMNYPTISDNKSKKRIFSKLENENLRSGITSQKIINKLSVHYFFSENSDIQDFFKKCKILIQIDDCNSPKKNKQLAEGNISPLSDFSVGAVETYGPMYQFNEITCFGRKLEKCTLSFYLGICKDSRIDTSLLNLYALKDFKIYYTDNSYYNSFCLPLEWMELLQDKPLDNRIHIEKEITENNDTIEKYEPLINSHQMKIFPKERFRIIHGFESRQSSPRKKSVNSSEKRLGKMKFITQLLNKSIYDKRKTIPINSNCFANKMNVAYPLRYSCSQNDQETNRSSQASNKMEKNKFLVRFNNKYEVNSFKIRNISNCIISTDKAESQNFLSKNPSNAISNSRSSEKDKKLQQILKELRKSDLTKIYQYNRKNYDK